MKKIILVSLFIVFTANITSETIIRFGRNIDEIGVDRGEGEIWKPLFFDVDKSGNIHIPDFYKGRVAIFKPDGQLYKEIVFPDGISPRMNYFCLNLDGTYTTYDNYTLYLINQVGETIWSNPMGLGAIPTRLYTDNRGVFIQFSGSNIIQYGYSHNNPIGTVDSLLLSKKYKVDDAMLVFQEGKNTIWLTNGRIKSVLVKNGKKNIKKIAVPNNITSGSGYWVVRGKDSKLYSSLFTEDNVSIMQLK